MGLEKYDVDMYFTFSISIEIFNRSFNISTTTKISYSLSRNAIL